MTGAALRPPRGNRHEPRERGFNHAERLAIWNEKLSAMCEKAETSLTD